jgi:hypothetical protein
VSSGADGRSRLQEQTGQGQTAGKEDFPFVIFHFSFVIAELFCPVLIARILLLVGLRIVTPHHAIALSATSHQATTDVASGDH